jgi:hypothetical protein
MPTDPKTKRPEGEAAFSLQPAMLPEGNVRVYEYGARLDAESREAVGDQIFKARRLYNALVACIRDVVEGLHAFEMESAGPVAAELQRRIELLNAAFDAARADDDEPEMKRVAQERRLLWPELGALLKRARQAHKQEAQERFLNRIGKRATCDTYKLRCAAVADGLGWATANQILDNALVAFKKSFQRGQAPRFARGEDKIQDTLTLQFTTAGGVPAKTLLSGAHGELAIEPTNGCGRRKYGSFRFRLGPASAGLEASGTWQYHRPLPEDATIGLARLVRRKLGKDTKWALQLMVKSPLPPAEHDGARRPLVAVHFGWAEDVTGRRVAGVTDGADPGQARVLQLPPDVEAGLLRAAELQSQRDSNRDLIVARIKSEPWDGRLLVKPESDAASWTPAERAADALAALRRLPAQHVAASRLHRVCRLLREADALPEWLDVWRKEDRLHWQSSAHAARRARNLRRDFYRKTALDLAQRYSAILIEPLDLAAAAKKVNETTGEKTEFARKARAGRTVAAVYEFESAIRWAAAKQGSAVIELTGPTASQCSVCGSVDVVTNEDDSQLMHCLGCGAELDRKQNGAALAWQAAHDDLDTLVEDFWRQRMEAQRERKERQAEKKAKLAGGRQAARAAAAREVG